MNLSTLVMITIINAKKYIEGCLYSFLSQQKKTSKDIIVDAFCEDKLVDICINKNKIIKI